MQSQQARVTWKDGVPVSTAFDDPYFSLENGVAETRHVFLNGNDLQARWGSGFRIAELGFGTGLNLAVTAVAWQEADLGGRLQFTSFEQFPMAADECAQALSFFPEVAGVRAPLVEALATGAEQFTLFGSIDVTLIFGDARETVPTWGDQADAWYLDGFSPAKNPELWSEALMRAVFEHTAPGGTAATYAAAGFVRRNLSDAGFSVERTDGFGRKRHMTRAIKPT